MLKSKLYDPIQLEMKHLSVDLESQEYGACSFELNGRTIVSRNAKITPKKTGQFVTCWKRIGNGPIEPFNDKDNIDYLVVNICQGSLMGQFVFPKSELIKRAVLSSGSREGKRAIRVYPPWDKTNSKQAAQTQKWQLVYYLSLDFGGETDLKKAKTLYTSHS